MAQEATDVCLRVLKESNKSRFDGYCVRNSVLIISHVTFRDCRVHIFSDNLSRNSCMHQYHRLKSSSFFILHHPSRKVYPLFVGRLGKNLQRVKCEWKTRLKSNNNDKESISIVARKMRNIYHFIHAWRWNIIKQLRIISNINRGTSELFEAIWTSCFIYQVWNAWLASCFKLFASITPVEKNFYLEVGHRGPIITKTKE